MYHSILVPLDGSQFAEQALPLAVSIANQASASLDLVQVHRLWALQSCVGGWEPYYEPAQDAACRGQERAYLDTITRNVQEMASISVSSALTEGGVVDCLLERARTKPADLIVMTTHGRGPMSRIWLGSIADELVRHASVPILLVRPQEASANQRPEPTLRRILIPLDGSKLAERMLEPAIALGSLMDAEYTLTQAVESSSLLDGYAVIAEPDACEQGREERRAVAQAYLDRVAERLRTRGFRVQTQVVVGESPAAGVLDVARDRQIDLIALTTHGRSGLKRLFLGSVADKIVRGTLTPVLVYRPTTNG